jgi:hypothetical protein
MKNSKVVTLIMVCLVFGNQAYTQKKIAKLSNYAGKDYWLVEKNGLKGLKSKKGDMIVPVAYDLALPAVQDEFSYIIKNGNLGLYDNIMQLEIVIEENQTIVNLYEGEDKSYLLVFGKRDNYYSDKRIYYILKRNGLNVIKPVKKSYEYINSDKSIKNGLEKTKNSKIIHQFSQLIYDETGKFSREKSIQKTGVYSLELNKFIVNPQFLSIERSIGLDLSEHLTYYDYYEVSQLISESKEKTGQFTIVYGLYNLNLEEVVSPKPSRTIPSGSGGYFRISPNNSLFLFSAQGELICTLPNIKEVVASVNVVGDLFYIGFYYDDGGVNMEMKMDLQEYHVYDKDGKLLKKEKFEINFSYDSYPVKIVTVQDPKNEWDFLVGLFNIQKADYEILPVYNKIRKRYYKEGLIKCNENNCSYYYKLTKGDEHTFIDQNLRALTPQRAISKDVFEDLYLDEFYYDYYNEGIALEIHNYDSAEIQLHKINENNITLAITNTSENVSFDQKLEFYGYINSSDQKVEIIASFSTYAHIGDNPEFGLRYIGSKEFILPPFFSQMEFNKENNTLEFTYKGESGSILLERYDY